MLQVRHGVFETNSSSVHTFILSQEPFKGAYPATVVFTFDEFGWEFDSYDDMWNKASYLYTALANLYSYEEAKDMLSSMLLPLGIQCEFAPPSKDSYYNMGYIDHIDECEDFIKNVMQSPETLCQFLFDNRSYIHTGNDNCDESDYPWIDKISEDYKYIQLWKTN